MRRIRKNKAMQVERKKVELTNEFSLLKQTKSERKGLHRMHELSSSRGECARAR
jgi:hypothetical protein